MRKKTRGLMFLAVIAAVSISDAIAQAQTWTTKVGAVPACRSQELVDRIERVRSDGDKEALVRIATIAVLAGECIFLSKGETVYARVESVWSGTLRIRKKGEVPEYLSYSRFFDWDQLGK